MRITPVFAAIVLILLLFSPGALAESGLPEAVKSQIDSLDMHEAESVVAELVGDDSLSLQSILDRLANGESAIDAEAIVNAALRLLTDMLRGRVPFMLTVMSGALLGALATRLCPKATYLGELTCITIASGSVLNDFISLMSGADSAIGGLSRLTQALFPLLITLLSAMGGQTSGGLLHTASASLTGVALTYMREYVTALLGISAALVLIGCMTDMLKTDKLAALMRTACHLLLGSALVILLGVMSINNSIGATADGVSVRTAKYAIDNMVPIVGGEVADTVEVLAASCGLAQNMVGTAGIALIAFACIRPIAVLLGAYVSYKASAAILDVMGDGRVPKMLEGFAGMLVTLLATLLSVCTMFIMLLGACMEAGRRIMMLR